MCIIHLTWHPAHPLKHETPPAFRYSLSSDELMLTYITNMTEKPLQKHSEFGLLYLVPFLTYKSYHLAASLTKIWNGSWTCTIESQGINVRIPNEFWSIYDCICFEIYCILVSYLVPLRQAHPFSPQFVMMDFEIWQ